MIKLSNPAMQMLIEENAFVLLEDMEWETPTFKCRIPAGFITDLDSIPALGRPFIKRNGPQRLPAIPHDYVHVMQFLALGESNGLMNAGMKVLGTSWLQRNLIYGALRAGSWVSWNKNARAHKEDLAGFLKSYGLPKDWHQRTDEWLWELKDA